MVSFQSPLFKPGAPILGKACSLLTGFLAEPPALTGGDHSLLREDPDIRKVNSFIWGHGAGGIGLEPDNCQWSDNNQHRHLCPSHRFREQQAPSTGSTSQRMAVFPQACGQLGYDWLVMSAKSRGGGGGSPSTFISDTELNRPRASNQLSQGSLQERGWVNSVNLVKGHRFHFSWASDLLYPEGQCQPCIPVFLRQVLQTL